MVTEFQKRVFDAVSRIPCGAVSTYGQVARYIGCGSPRAVGQALKRNPFAPRVPCHRVIAGTLCVGGFQGKQEGAPIKRKLAMLAAEGVRFAPDGRLRERTRLFDFK